MKKYKNMIFTGIIAVVCVAIIIFVIQGIWLAIPAGFLCNIIFLVCIDKFFGGWTHPHDEWDWKK